MKSKFKYSLGIVIKHKLKKGNFLIIARSEREHICGVADIQYLIRDEKFQVHEVDEGELKN